MNWQELTEKQATEYVDYLNGYKDSLEQLNADKKMILDAAKCKEADLPPNMKDMLARNAEGWKSKWSLYGSEYKNLRYKQQKEINIYFEREGIINELGKSNSRDQEDAKSRVTGR